MRAPTSSGFAPRSRVILACLALLIAAPAAARAQDARLAARLDSLTGRQVAELLDAARSEKLPVEPLVDKALEGASKRAPGPRIVDAVRRLSAELAESRRLLGPQATPAEVTAGAHALRANIAPAALKRLYEKRGRTTITASLAVYQELVAQKVPSDTAAASVLALQQAGVPADRLATFQNDVARDIAVGGEPGMAAAATSGLMAGEQAFADGLQTTSGFVPDNRNGTTRPPKRKP